jgi:SpoVK/Ycf46/Vps4 family AAA+-type ATPase
MIFPFGNRYVKGKLNKKEHSFLFYGPPGGGKTMMVRAIATETRALVFDISPKELLAKFTE